MRPPNKRELALAGGVIVGVGEDLKTVTVSDRAGQQQAFAFDVAFPTDATQLRTFELVGVDIVRTCFHGFNASVFAYGQVCCSKHT